MAKYQISGLGQNAQLLWGYTSLFCCSRCQSMDERSGQQNWENWLCHPANPLPRQKMGRSQGVELVVQTATVGFSPDSHPAICDWGPALLHGAQLVHSWRFPLITASCSAHLHFALPGSALWLWWRTPSLRDCGRTLLRPCKSGSIFTRSSHRPRALGIIPS